MCEDSEIEEKQPPNKKDLVQAYIQYSEESRYRDRVMHNSYYFILIAIVLISVQLLSVNLDSSLLVSLSFGISLLMVGFALFGIVLVMISYHNKRVYAEHRRQVIERALDDKFSKKGWLNEYSNPDYGYREYDNPFAIQEMVTARAESPIYSAIHDKIDLSDLALVGGFIAIIIGISGLVIITVNIV